MAKLKWTGIALGGVLALAAGGCATNNTGAKIDPTRLAGLAPDQMQPVTQAEANLRQAKVNVNKAKHDKTAADDQLKLAKSQVPLAEGNLHQAQTKRNVEKQAQQAREEAQEQVVAPGEVPPPAPPQVVPPNPSSAENVRQAKVALATTKAKVAYFEKLDDIAGTKIKLADKKVELAKADLNKARFQVLKESNPAEVRAMKVHAADVNSEVAHKQADVASVQTDLAKQRDEAREAYQKWASLDHQLGKMPQEEMHRLEVPPPPQG